ncbi:MAG: AEC family transporter, partial [Pseudomonadota bacterium]
LNPALIAIAIAVAMTVAGAKPPKWIANTTDLIGDASIPLMLLTLGVSLGRLSAENLPRSFGLGAFRLAIGFAAGLGVATLFGLEGAAWGVLIIQASMPAAVFNFLFAHLYDQRPDEVAGVIVASSLLSLVTAPLVVAYVLANAG